MSLAMTAVGILMIEHRKIERVIEVMKKEVLRMIEHKEANPVFVDTVVDFIRIYADKSHHGKEEDIFFVALNKENLPQQDKEFIAELVEEHALGRETVGKLLQAKETYTQGRPDAFDEIIECMKWLIEFYPAHIEKEDKKFFGLYKAYLNNEEQEQMLADFYEFGKYQLHAKYEGVVEALVKIMEASERFRERST